MKYFCLLLLFFVNLYSYSYNVVTSDAFNPIKDDGYDYSLYTNYNTSVVTDGDYDATYYKNDLIFNDEVYSSCYNVFTSKSSPCIVDENGYGVIVLGSDSNFESYSMLDSINRAYFDSTYINKSYAAVWGRANHRDPYYEFYLEPECGQDCDELRAEYLYYDNLNYKVVLAVSDNIYYNYRLRKFIYFYPYKVEESINDSGFFDGVDNFFTSAKYSFLITENSTRYTCPVGSKFNPNTGLCVKDCTDYDVSDSDFKIQMEDGRCLIINDPVKNSDIAKAYCEFVGSEYRPNNGVNAYKPNTNLIHYFCTNNTNYLLLPDDLFNKAPEVNKDNEDNDNGSNNNQGSDSTTEQENSGSNTGGSTSTDGANIGGGTSGDSITDNNKDNSFTQTEITGGNGSSDSNSTSGNKPGGGSSSGGVGTDGTDGNGADQGGESEGEGIGNTDKEAVEGALGGLGGVFDGIFDSFFELGNSLDEMLTNLENSVNSVKDSLKPFGNISATTVTTCPLDFSYSSPYPINFSIDLCTPLYSVNGLVYSIIFLSILSLSVIFFIKILIMLLATF